MISDSFFIAGRHINCPYRPCQDYAYNGYKPNGQAFVVVADGCSSSFYTDIGARILTHLASKRIQEQKNIDVSFLDESCFALQNLGLHIDSLDLSSPLDCTLLLAEEKEQTLDFLFLGDGSLCIKKSDQSYDWYHIEYSSNAPYFLSYQLPEKLDAYYQNGLGSRNNYYKEVFPNNRKILQKEILVSDEINFDIVSLEQNEIPLFEPWFLSINKTEVESAVIFSDGLDHFCRQDRSLVDAKSILHQICTNLKNCTPNILQRNLKTFIKWTEENHYFPNDDFSVGLLAFSSKHK